MPAHHQPINLARYLARHAAPAPPARQSKIVDVMTERALVGEYRNPQDRRAVRSMEKVWRVAQGYFPGRAMPVPKFTKGGDPTGAVGWQGNQPIGVHFDRDTARSLNAHDPYVRDQALRTLVHEWAHNFQKPGMYRQEQGAHRPMVEGGAEAFSYAVAPGIAHALGRSYRKAGPSLRYSEYRPDVARVLRRKGMGWIMRGQFGD